MVLNSSDCLLVRVRRMDAALNPFVLRVFLPRRRYGSNNCSLILIFVKNVTFLPPSVALQFRGGGLHAPTEFL